MFPETHNLSIVRQFSENTQKKNLKMGNQRFLITWLSVFCISAPILSTIAEDIVPVFVWGGDAPGLDLGPANPLRKTSTSDFGKIVAKKVGESQPPVLVFMRDNFCAEDVLQHKKDLMQLQKIRFFEYFPAVDSPLSVFEALPSYNLSLEEDPETVLEGQLVITEATDLDSVSETFNIIRESSPNLIAALTGRTCGYSKPERIRRAVDVKSENGTTFIIARNESRLLAHAEKATFQKGIDGPVVTLGSPTAVVSTMNFTLGATVWVNATFQDDSVKTEIAFELKEKSSGYFSMKRVIVTSGNEARNMTINNEIVFPNAFSYHCAQTISFLNNTNNWSLNFTKLQMQVDVKNFTEPYDCVGFTSIPIWSGLFVTLILAMILMWGISMILDIRTMDRFDDPKGKTITVSASE